MKRVYLDWAATAPLRNEARQAMAEAMDVVGNPSSVHTEGRAAKALLERARETVLEALGAPGWDLVFTSGATEAAGLACAGRGLVCAPLEHESVLAWCAPELQVEAGRVLVPEPGRSVVQLANSETGIVQDVPDGVAVCDLTQAFGKMPFALNWMGVGMGFVSAHKIGGPKGVGALVFPAGTDVAAQIKGGGQERGWRSGTENLIGIAGFAAAARAAQADLAAGVWERVAEFRNVLDKGIEAASNVTILVGETGPRLPNISCFITPGWKAETQVMVMDLAGFAVSAGSACSSGKVRGSQVLTALGFDETQANSGLRVSIGPETEKEDVLRFVEAWGRKVERRG